MINQRVLVRMLRRDVLIAARMAELRRLAAEVTSWKAAREASARDESVEMPEEHRALRQMLLRRMGGPAADPS